MEAVEEDRNAIRMAAQRPTLESLATELGVLLRPSPVFRDSEIATPPFPVNVATIQEEITRP